MHHGQFDSRRTAGGALVPVLFVLVVLLGLGGWNYHRNLQAEARDDRPRPFKGYAEEDLEAMRAAYEHEAAEFQKRYSAQDAKRQRSTGGGLMDENLEAFERAQASSGRLRELRADVADREARLRELEQELNYRSASLSGVKLHLKRLLTL